jgi:hypothetical protein
LSHLRNRTVTAAQRGLQTFSKYYTMLLGYIVRGLCTQNIDYSLMLISQAGEIFGGEDEYIGFRTSCWVIGVGSKW